MYVDHTIWEEFLNIAKEEVGIRVVETWFKAVTFAQWDAEKKIIYLQAPNQFVRDWIQKNYHQLLSIHLGRLLHSENPSVCFLETSQQPRADLVVPVNTEVRMVPAQVAVQKKRTGLVRISSPKKQSTINKSYLFENFVVGPSNSLAYAAAHAIAEKPGRLYNPLFMYGGSGLGKTHLLHAIGNGIQEQSKGATVLYQTADRFVTEFISAIRFDKVERFQEKYKSVDVLLIDDVQFISHKEQTQEAFFHIFNTLYDAHKQIIFSSDTVPQDMQGIAERLRSRLAWGLVADIYMPSVETKIAILKKKAASHAVVLADDIAHFIASRAIANIRELEGALIRVIAFASLTKQDLSLELAQRVLQRTDAPERPAIDLARVSSLVHKQYGYDLKQLQSKGRDKDVVFARQLAMFLMKRHTNKSLRDIGVFLGGRDHSTVMHSIEKIEQSLADQSDLQIRIKKMEDELSR
ncbi:chromosomal replication initiator protein DnaA [Candidatus Dependentiae bacterium HGW-Dependentiae-1]|nr:MAG: chromosomal replication initiator protein DnaA [Candidatus Dependentiae bacterium HGW-Dependentiae-1]